MRALTMDELEFVSGGFEGGSQLVGPDQLGFLTNSVFGGGGEFGSFQPAGLGSGFGWPFSCDAECQVRRQEAERRRREEEERKRQLELALQQLRNNRLAICANRNKSYFETGGSVTAQVNIGGNSGGASITVTAPSFGCR
jgi:hypothetical protein